MSDDGDIDVESAEDVPDIGGEATATTTNGTIYSRGNSHDKRAHHNALERRRRDHIKDSFHGLRDCIPSLVGEKVSRAHILNKATEYIRHMQKGGSTREDDICDLARKNEILEEQVRSLEEAKVEGVPVNTEELLQSVANRVQARQAQEVLQQLQAKNNVKTSKQQGSNKGQSKTTPSSASSDKTSTKSPPTATCADTPSTNTPTSSSSHSSQLLPPNFNILASNLKSTQSLLSVLQKNLSPNSNLPSNIKSLAARVLASPLVRAQKTSQVTSLPRGIVTATTVPKGNNTSPSVSLSKSPVKVTGITTNTTTMSSDNADSAQISTPTVTDTTGDSTTDVGGNIQEDTTAIQTPEGDDESDAQAPAQHIQTDVPAVVPNPPAPLSVGQASPTFLTSQLLEVHNHLQQQGAGFTSNLPSGPDYGGVQGLNQELDSSSSIAASTLNTAAQSLNITPELLAQVSSFLNLPPLSSTAGTSPSSGPSLIPQDTFPQELPQTVPTTTPISVKRPASSSEHDALSTKKPHLDL